MVKTYNLFTMLWKNFYFMFTVSVHGSNIISDISVDNDPTIPCPAKLYKVETQVSVSTAFQEKKKIEMSLLCKIFHFQAPI